MHSYFLLFAGSALLIAVWASPAHAQELVRLVVCTDEIRVAAGLHGASFDFPEPGLPRQVVRATLRVTLAERASTRPSVLPNALRYRLTESRRGWIPFQLTDNVNCHDDCEDSLVLMAETFPMESTTDQWRTTEFSWRSGRGEIPLERACLEADFHSESHHENSTHPTPPAPSSILEEEPLQEQPIDQRLRSDGGESEQILRSSGGCGLVAHYHSTRNVLWGVIVLGVIRGVYSTRRKNG